MRLCVRGSVMADVRQQDESGQSFPEPPIVELSECRVEVDRRQVLSIQGQVTGQLTTREADLFRYLVERPGETGS